MNYKDYLVQKNNNGHFWYEARKVLIKKLLSSKLVGGKNDRRILDIGCGIGSELETISLFGEIEALDIDHKALKIARENGHKTNYLNIGESKLEKNSYGAICAFDVLEHIENDYFAINNIFEGLKNEGYFFFTVPAHPFMFSQHDIGTGHKRRYTKKDIQEKLESEGFKTVEVYYWNFTLFPAIFLYRKFKKIFFKKTSLESEAKTRNKYLNRFLFYILKIEATGFLMKKTPPGLSIYGVARK
jgi:SAM-dependent methyltransferase